MLAEESFIGVMKSHPHVINLYTTAPRQDYCIVKSVKGGEMVLRATWWQHHRCFQGAKLKLSIECIYT